MKKLLIKSLSVLLSILFVVSIIPNAYAVEEETSNVETTTKIETTTKKETTTKAPTTKAKTTKKSKTKEVTTKPSTTVKKEKSTVVSETTEKPTQSRKDVKQTLEQQRAELEARQKRNDDLLSKYQDDAKVCEEYIDALDVKIGCMNEELNLLDREIKNAKANVNKLKPQITSLQDEMKKLQDECDKAQKELNGLNKKFQTTYDAYCLRLRAMYISGNSSVIVALITSKDLSQFLGRYSMIKAIARSDTELLKEVNVQIDKITNKQNGLNEKNQELEGKKKKLAQKKKSLDNELSTIESKQKQVASKKISLSDMRAESDSLLSELTEKTQMYTEFRNEDEELIAAVDKEIDDLLNGLVDPAEVTTVSTEEQTTSAKKENESNDGELYSHSNAVLNMNYPVPGHYGVSCGFGYYSSGKPHTGTDFPCPIGSKVVAAQKGIVITVKRLNYSYGYYVMIYHGTDARGRKIVTLYAHNSSLLVSVGQTVRKGQQIAKSGSTGNSTGPHSHFEVIISGTKVNAKNYLSR